MKFYTPRQFAVWRIGFGIYLFLHFLRIIPSSAEMYSSRGVFDHPSYNFTYGFFPNPLNYYDSPAMVISFISVMALLSLFFTLGFLRRPSALLLWFGWACLFNRNNLTMNPSLPFTGWLILASTMIPSGEGLLLSQKGNRDWDMPNAIYFGAWIIAGTAYTYSGWAKLFSPSWLDGTAMVHLYKSPIAIDSLPVSLSLQLPLPLISLQTWGAMLIQILSLPSYLFYRTRFFGWSLMVALHLMVILTLDLLYVSAGMLFFHWFLFDHRWFKQYSLRERLSWFWKSVASRGLLTEAAKFQQ